MSNKPVLFDLEETERETSPSVSDAPPVPDALDIDGKSTSAVVVGAARVISYQPSRLARWFWAVVLSLLGAVISIAAWDFALAMIARFPMVGWALSAGFVLALLLLLLLVLRELAALLRLRKLDGLRQSASRATSDIAAARAFASSLSDLYRDREDLSWQRARLKEQQDEVLDADALLMLTEDELLRPLDAQALHEVEAGARQVATVTALVPLALADVAVALLTSMRVIRRVAQIYGGRPGYLSSWRLLRAVLAHLAATGAVAAGDDLLDSVLGGSVLSKLSRRFGEGLINGALSARVGIAAMEICRPMPFSPKSKPSTRKVIKGALAGLFQREKGTSE